MSTTTTAGNRALRISPSEVVSALEEHQNLTVLDARSSKAYAAATERIHGDHRIDPDNLRIDPSWPRDQLTVVYCTCPGEETSLRVLRLLRDKGFTQAYALEGGFDAWRAHSGPIEPK